MGNACLVVVDEVHQDLHDTREDQHTGGCDEEDVDVVQWLILLFFGSWHKLKQGMSGSDPISYDFNDSIRNWNIQKLFEPVK